MLSRLKPNMARAPLLLVVIFVVLAYRCSSDTSAEDRMIDWVRQAGGEVNVEVATVDGLRGTAVTKDIPEGGTIAFVPQKLMYIACSNKDDPLVATAAKLMQEIANSSAAAAVYWATMPTQQELLSVYSFPMSYIPLLQTVAGEGYMMNQQSELERWWLENKGPLLKEGFTQENLQHAAGLIATRTFSTNFGTHTMIPLLDLANHDTACPNYRQVRPCPDDKDMQCMYWLAGKDYKKGEAACHSYGGMFNDRAFIQYGFVIQQPQPPHLYGVDRHDFDPEQIWGNQLFDKVMPEPFKSGTSSGYKQEADRLRRILYKLQRMDKSAGRTERDDADPSGQILAMVLRWRELRKDALTAEISRIRGLLEGKGEKLKTEAQYMKQVAAQAAEGDDDDDAMGGADDEDDEYADEL